MVEELFMGVVTSRTPKYWKSVFSDTIIFQLWLHLRMLLFDLIIISALPLSTHSSPFYNKMNKNLLVLLLTAAVALYTLSASHSQTSVIVDEVAANETCLQDCCGKLPSRLPMTYTYYQKSGKLVGGSGNYSINTHGYSGQGSGYNNPDMQCVVNTGPLPAARYKISYCKNVMHTNVTRPCSFYLDPQEPSKMCGRGEFFIHGCDCCTTGDSKIPPAAGCSAGCVVISYENRLKLRVGDTIIVEHHEPSMTTESQ